MPLVYEMQALTWRARSARQQDAILINGKVIQHDGLISRHCHAAASAPWCVAVADGVSSSPGAEQAAQQLLDGVWQQASHSAQSISFQALQQHLNRSLANNEKYYGASTTLALVSHSSPQNFVNIQHLGDSRVYLFCSHSQQWRCLTHDHNYLEQLRLNGELQAGEQYATIYNALLYYFCADPLHEVPELAAQEEYLTPDDALLLCTDGLHDVMECHEWPALQADMALKEWLKMMKQMLEERKAYDNASMVLVRLTEGEKHDAE
ncbi:PP2C family protein-serine/threonine phosphatase [Acinetobacter sp.]|uniref:PP2C family protein-serine/threonine phosphatase n=1 Tax=Acinetobacter sp. TaxID=472 RepID=UPI002FC6BB55